MPLVEARETQLADRTMQIYFIFIGIDIACFGLTWIYFPEFRYLSLEEIDYVFETPGVHPVTMSKKLQKSKVETRRYNKEKDQKA